jgi:hypothetical protein
MNWLCVLGFHRWRHFATHTGVYVNFRVDACERCKSQRTVKVWPKTEKDTTLSV